MLFCLHSMPNRFRTSIVDSVAGDWPEAGSNTASTTLWFFIQPAGTTWPDKVLHAKTSSGPGVAITACWQCANGCSVPSSHPDLKSFQGSCRCSIYCYKVFQLPSMTTWGMISQSPGIKKNICGKSNNPFMVSVGWHYPQELEGFFSRSPKIPSVPFFRQKCWTVVAECQK